VSPYSGRSPGTVRNWAAVCPPLALRIGGRVLVNLEVLDEILSGAIQIEHGSIAARKTALSAKGA
jgi:hypothetical protein